MSNVAQRSFSGGEFSPQLYARTDAAKYGTGLRTCRNFQIMKAGGAQNRAGTDYITSTKANGAVRLIEFIFNDAQTYVLVFGDRCLRFLQNGAPVVLPVGIATYDPAVTYAAGALVTSAGVTYYSILGSNLGNTPAANPVYWYVLPTDGTYEIPTPYLISELAGLNYVQSADVITLVHQLHPPAQLARLGSTDWTYAPIAFAPLIAAPGGVSGSGGAAGPSTTWTVTAVAPDTLEESLTAPVYTANVTPTGSSPVALVWSTVPGASQYNVYRSQDGVTFGFIGASLGGTFSDVGATPNASISPPRSRNPFYSLGNYPGSVGYYQQRLFFGKTVNNPEGIWSSKSAAFKNFSVSTPLQEDDAITFTLVGKRVSSIHHFVDLQKLLVFTENNMWSIDGDQSGIVSPTAINARVAAAHGALETIPPLTIGKQILFVQSRGTIVRDLLLDYLRGYQGNDLTLFSQHLFQGFSLIDWAYQEIFESVIWIVRSDGTLLGLTYDPEQQILAWHRHDTAGAFEQVCVIPEGGEDRLYVVVRRVINGATVRYIERLSSRIFTDQRDANFTDAALAYDGRNTDLSNPGTLSAGTTWDTADAGIRFSVAKPTFSSADVGKQIFMVAADGSELRLDVLTYISSTILGVHAQRTVPADLRSTSHVTWSRAVATVSGLTHLEGQTIAATGDGFVIASPNNSAYVALTVTGGKVTFDRQYAVIHVGLPYVADFATLDIDTASGPSLKANAIQVNRVGLYVKDTRGFFAGRATPTGADPLAMLQEYKARDVSDGYNDPIAPVTGYVDINIESSWDKGGSIFVRQVDPLPMTILAAIPQGLIPPTS